MTADAPASSAHPQRARVVVVGAGPAGLTPANILRAASVDCVVLENESRQFIEQRPRAGFLEEWAVRALERRGLAERLLANTVQCTPSASSGSRGSVTGSRTRMCRASGTTSTRSRCW